jgi:thiamine-monophosphate kinase
MAPDDESISGEEAIIALLRPLAGPEALGFSDDCAALTPRPGMDIVLKTDPVAEGIHFLSSDTPEDIAWKALAVNVSDLAAKGARPIGYLMALSFPQAPRRDWLQRFALGLQVAQTRFGCALLGGDTDRRPGPITISITVLGEVPAGTMVQRAKAKARDLLFVSGSIGDAGLGLRLCRTPELAATWQLAPDHVETLVQRYRRPQPRLALAAALRAHASAAMDLSDGLVKDLGRMLRASGVAGSLDLARVPLSKPASEVVKRDPALLPKLVTAGDDYEILAAVPPDRGAAFAAQALADGVVVTRVGQVESARVDTPLCIRDAIGNDVHVQSDGWDHF